MSMRPLRTLLVLVVFGLGTAALQAQDAAQESSDQDAAEGETSPGGQQAAEGANEADEPEVGAAEARSSGAEEGFVPTEELDADEEVTFPVDI